MTGACSCCHDAPALEVRDVVRAEITKRPPATSASRTVADVSRDPRALAVLAQRGINHCCGAHLTLAEAAAAAGVPLDDLLRALDAAMAGAPA